MGQISSSESEDAADRGSSGEGRVPCDAAAAALLPDDPNRIDVFVSHESSDSAEIIRNITAAFLGLRVFNPSKDLVRPSKEEMEDYVRRAQACVVAVSPNYFVSEFCCAEALAAMTAKVPIIPVFDDTKYSYAAGRQPSKRNPMYWKAELEEYHNLAKGEQGEKLRKYVYSTNLVPVLSDYDQERATSDLIVAVSKRVPSLRQQLRSLHPTERVRWPGNLQPPQAVSDESSDDTPQSATCVVAAAPPKNQTGPAHFEFELEAVEWNWEAYVERRHKWIDKKIRELLAFGQAQQPFVGCSITPPGEYVLANFDCKINFPRVDDVPLDVQEEVRIIIDKLKHNLRKEKIPEEDLEKIVYCTGWVGCLEVIFKAPPVVFASLFQLLRKSPTGRLSLGDDVTLNTLEPVFMFSGPAHAVQPLVKRLKTLPSHIGDQANQKVGALVRLPMLRIVLHADILEQLQSFARVGAGQEPISAQQPPIDDASHLPSHAGDGDASSEKNEDEHSEASTLQSADEGASAPPNAAEGVVASGGGTAVREEVERVEVVPLAKEKAERLEAERLAKEETGAKSIAAQFAQTERIAEELGEAERIGALKVEAEHIATEKAEADRLDANIVSKGGAKRLDVKGASQPAKRATVRVQRSAPNPTDYSLLSERPEPGAPVPPPEQSREASSSSDKETREHLLERTEADAAATAGSCDPTVSKAKVDVGSDEALWSAASNGFVLEVERLLDEGGNPNWENPLTGSTALHNAAIHGHAEIVRTLLLSGAKSDVQNEFGDTALHVAAMADREHTVRVLVEHGVNINSLNKDSFTPLHYAASEGHISVAEVLISSGAHLDAENSDGSTPLHLAAFNDRCAVINVLVAFGASVNLKNKGGQTPRDIAGKATQATIDQALLLESKYETQVPLDRGKVFLCGDGGVGKSTIARALQRGDLSMMLWDLPKAVDERTHGFDSFPATIPTAGACTIVDFAGQPEYWATNAMFMDTVSGVFVVVCKLTDPFEEQYKQLRYWVRLIGSCSRPENKPRVVLVGTHRGAAKAIKKRLEGNASMHMLPPFTKNALEAALSRLARITLGRDGRWRCAEVDAYVAELREQLGAFVDISPRFHYVDSVSPAKGDRAEMASLRKCLGQALTDIRATRSMPKVCTDVIALLPGLRKVLPAVAPFDAVQQELKRRDKEEKIDFHNVGRMKAVLLYLSEAGHVMYFEDIGDIVVVDPQAFGTHVIGQLFCPVAREGFKSLILTEEDGLHFRQSQLNATLEHAHAQGHIFGDVPVMEMLVALEFVIPVSPAMAPGEAAEIADADPLYAVPGRLSSEVDEQRGPSSAVDGQRDRLSLALSGHRDRPSYTVDGQRSYLVRPNDYWGNITRDPDQWFYAGVRLVVSESQLMIPPSLFPRLQHRLSKEPSFRMWRGGLATRMLTDTGKVAVEGIVELDRSHEHMDVCVRTAIGDRRGCIQLLRRLVMACEYLGAHVPVCFTAALINTDSIRRHIEGGRQAVLHDPAAPRVKPSEWVDTQFARLLQPYGGRRQVFVSCTSDDSGSTFKVLVSSLRTRGFDVFEPVAPSVAEMQARVADSAVVLAVLSPGYFKSKDCCAEAAAALDAGITVIPVYDGDKYVHSANESQVLRWKAEETRESTQALRDYVYRGNVVRAVDTQDQTAAIESVFTAIADRCPHLRPGYVPDRAAAVAP